MERCSRGAPVLVVSGHFPAPGMSWPRQSCCQPPAAWPRRLLQLSSRHVHAVSYFLSAQRSHDRGEHRPGSSALPVVRAGERGQGHSLGAGTSPGEMGQGVFVGTTQPQ